jgi:hypothetical protein
MPTERARARTRSELIFVVTMTIVVCSFAWYLITVLSAPAS